MRVGQQISNHHNCDDAWMGLFDYLGLNLYSYYPEMNKITHTPIYLANIFGVRKIHEMKMVWLKSREPMRRKYFDNLSQVSWCSIVLIVQIRINGNFYISKFQPLSTMLTFKDCPQKIRVDIEVLRLLLDILIQWKTNSPPKISWR